MVGEHVVDVSGEEVFGGGGDEVDELVDEVPAASEESSESSCQAASEKASDVGDSGADLVNGVGDDYLGYLGAELGGGEGAVDLLGEVAGDAFFHFGEVIGLEVVEEELLEGLVVAFLGLDKFVDAVSDLVLHLGGEEGLLEHFTVHQVLADGGSDVGGDAGLFLGDESGGEGELDAEEVFGGAGTEEHSDGYIVGDVAYHGSEEGASYEYKGCHSDAGIMSLGLTSMVTPPRRSMVT